MKNTAVIVGGGAGTRFKGTVPKQFLPLGTKPLIVHTIDAFQRVSSIDAIVVVVPRGWEQRCEADFKPYAFDKLIGVITGGETRQLSCWQALQYLKADPPHIIVVHDAARPLVTEEMIETAVREGREGMTFGLRANDTIVECREGTIMRVLSRGEIYQIQTPQSFPFQTLWEAHSRALKAGITDAGDDAGLVLKAGKLVKVLLGDPRNIKITDPIDLELAQHFLHHG
jgi:2-C-methyl-D-erythritol 4-phosphate cytidylyltransferase